MATPFAQAMRADHQTIYTLRDKYVSLKSTNPTAAAQVVLQLLWELSRHIAVEQILIHPWYIKTIGPDAGSKLAAFDDADHQRIKDEILTLLNLNLNPNTPEFDNGIEKIVGDVHRHNDSEEESDVPTLESSITDRDNQILALGMEKSKEFFIPERFNPGDGTTITLNSLKAALTAPVEPLRAPFLEYLGLQGNQPYN